MSLKLLTISVSAVRQSPSECTGQEISSHEVGRHNKSGTSGVTILSLWTSSLAVMNPGSICFGVCVGGGGGHYLEKLKCKMQSIIVGFCAPPHPNLDPSLLSRQLPE